MVSSDWVTIAAVSRLIASIGSSDGANSTSVLMPSTPMHPQGGGADAVDLHPELGEEDAQVLDHVVRAGVAQHGDAGGERRGQQGVLGDGVAALGEGDRLVRLDGLVDRAAVEAVGRDHVEAEAAEHLQVRLDGAGAEVAAAGVRAARSRSRSAAAGRGT